ncbi:MAG: universal stress protein, partial [Sphingobacteriales bacterium]
MKTLLIPVDFSDATENVINYAAGFCRDTHVERIILLKSFYVSVYAQLLPSADFVQLSAADIDEERDKAEESLKALGIELLKICDPSIHVKTAVSELPLVRAIHQLIADERPSMVMIGTDKSLYEDDGYISEQVIT